VYFLKGKLTDIVFEARDRGDDFIDDLASTTVLIILQCRLNVQPFSQAASSHCCVLLTQLILYLFNELIDNLVNGILVIISKQLHHWQFHLFFWCCSIKFTNSHFVDFDVLDVFFALLI